jgi:hypothetical protein
MTSTWPPGSPESAADLHDDYLHLLAEQEELLP